MPRPAVLLFDTFGPYHLSRLAIARDRIDLVGLEVGGRSDDYPWFDQAAGPALRRLFPDVSSGAVPASLLRRTLYEVLDRIDPPVIAVPGWGTLPALYALAWAATRRRPVVMMCDSTAIDARRTWLLEKIKSSIVSGSAAGFASGSRSRDYLTHLGMDRTRISLGYDVVDNAHFATGAAGVEPGGYILSVGRLVEKKNIDGLLRGYALYHQRAGAAALPLRIVGDGPLRARLTAVADDLGLDGFVTFAGHVGYDDLPAVYGAASCFVLASTVEQWGLVVNEAIACGLPVLASSRCGAAADLVEEGANGYRCEPDPGSIADGLDRLCHHSDLASFGRHSRTIAAQWDLPAFAAGLETAIDTARAVGRWPGLGPVRLATILRSASRR